MLKLIDSFYDMIDEEAKKINNKIMRALYYIILYIITPPTIIISGLLGCISGIIKLLRGV